MIGKIFKAYDVRATYPEPLNEDAAWKVGFATGQFLKSADGSKQGPVLVSRDMRPHSPQLANELIDGVRATGMNVIDLGLRDTSFMYFAINHLGAAGGIQTTASHNPIHYNGFKISRELAKPVGADTGLKQIQSIAEALNGNRKPPVGTLRQMDLWDEYRGHILRFFRPPCPAKRPLKVFIDASNGMAGELVPKVFEGLEGLRIIPLNFEIGGGFAHEPNPLVAENMIPTQNGVREHAAAVGVCFDGDADRCMITDELGDIVGCDHLTALFAAHLLDKTDPDESDPIQNAEAGSKTIVYDLRSSKVVAETIVGLGATPLRSRVGHVFMKAALRESTGVFGGELSGHFYFRDNYYADSGAITLANVLWLLGQSDRTMSQLAEPFRRYPQSGEINFEVDDKDAVIQNLTETFGPGAEVDELDGVTIDAFEGRGWWFNVRPSNTEPLLRLNVEARDRDVLESALNDLKPHLGEPATAH